MINENKSYVLNKLKDLPAHHKIAAKSLDLLSRDEHVLGLYLTGSLADGCPDVYSDIDINILVEAEHREQILQDHLQLYRQVGKVFMPYAAIHMSDPNQMIVFYEETIPIHVDYQYRVESELLPNPKYRDIAIILDRNGKLTAWQDQCRQAPQVKISLQEKLQFLEDRFWCWCWYTNSKIERGELWEARESIDEIRNNVIIVLAYLKLDLPFEGSRRLEKKFPKDIIGLLISTVPLGINKACYKTALLSLITAYQKLIGDLLIQTPCMQLNQVNSEYMINAIKANSA